MSLPEPENIVPSASSGGASRRAPDQNLLPVLLRTWLLIALIDGLFSSVLNVAAYHSTVARLWQGVASVLLGPKALNGGTRTIAIGLLMHLTVAFTWSAVFLFLVMRLGWVRRAVVTPPGVTGVALLYGPCIWMVMSLVVIPFLLHRPPAITVRWWIQVIGHVPFVAFPIVASSSAGLRAAAARA